ncbi:hypothetical protein VUR80DRAFT_7352 [Thermomyces stellatus]
MLGTGAVQLVSWRPPADRNPSPCRFSPRVQGRVWFKVSRNVPLSGLRQWSTELFILGSIAPGASRRQLPSELLTLPWDRTQRLTYSRRLSLTPAGTCLNKSVRVSGRHFKADQDEPPAGQRKENRQNPAEGSLISPVLDPNPSPTPSATEGFRGRKAKTNRLWRDKRLPGGFPAVFS